MALEDALRRGGTTGRTAASRRGRWPYSRRRSHAIGRSHVERRNPLDATFWRSKSAVTTRAGPDIHRVCAGIDDGVPRAANTPASRARREPDLRSRQEELMRSSLDLECRFEAIVIVTHGVVAATETRAVVEQLLAAGTTVAILRAATRRGGESRDRRPARRHIARCRQKQHAPRRHDRPGMRARRHAARRAGHRSRVVPGEAPHGSCRPRAPRRLFADTESR